MKSRWSEQAAGNLPDLDGLLYASRLIGEDQNLVVWGGGNTSAKVLESDFRGHATHVLRIKGSGSDLRTIRVKDFPGVRLDDVLPLLGRDAMSDAAMVDYLGHTLMERSSPRPSIETLLHAFLPARFIIHTHADAILSLTNTPSGHRWITDVLGAGAVCIPYERPGFSLSKRVALAFASSTKSSSAPTCVILEKHGLITWGDSAKEAYEATIDACSRAEDFIAARRSSNTAKQRAQRDAALDHDARVRVFTSVAPKLRGLAGRTAPDGTVREHDHLGESPRNGRVVLRFDDDPAVLDFMALSNAKELSQVGPTTPDHLISSRRTAMFIDLDGAFTEVEAITEIEQTIAATWCAWTAEYLRYVQDGSANVEDAATPPVLDPRPRVVLISGIGMVTIGRDARATRIVSDVYHHAIATARDADAVEAYASLSPHECFGVEYWPLETYKLTLAPPETELSRKIAVVTGAASGIGRAIAVRLCQEGAHVALADVNVDGARAIADELNTTFGSGRAIAMQVDVADERQVKHLYAETVRAYGGLDVLVSNAGIAPFGTIDTTSFDEWRRSLAINATGHFLVLREAIKVLKQQKLGGSVIFITTKNTLAPGKEFAAYSAAKSAQLQLGRVAAMELGEFGIRVNMINPDAIFRGSALWSPELRRARSLAHGVDSDEGLEEFYRKRNLLGQAILPEDVAEVAWWLASERSRKTTGGVLTVDGGVAAAFPR